MSIKAHQNIGPVLYLLPQANSMLVAETAAGVIYCVVGWASFTLR